MDVEIRAEAALFPKKEYINGIAVAVQSKTSTNNLPSIQPPLFLISHNLQDKFLPPPMRLEFRSSSC